ncbi:MAG: glycosyl hydrolase, partial [Spirochaetales bacterium]|nr:glycosyl hydrolase [Spirochaetales bacterium]
MTVGSGSYTTSFPGTDAAGRNGYPSGSPQLSGNALGKPVPTNDWWSTLIKENHASNLFNYPMGFKTINSGLVVSYIPWGVYDDLEPIIVGVSDLNATNTTVSDYSDWTVTMDWSNNAHNFKTTSGIGMPFIYFEKSSADIAKITVNHGTATLSNEMILIENAHSGADFVVYAPSGSSWEKNGSEYTSTLNGKDYWSMAMLPLSASNINTVAAEYQKYAYVFPSNTTTSWSFDESNSVVRTDFVVETSVKEGSETNMLLGLLPHQWDNLASDSPQPDQYTYPSVRGELKTLEGNSFSVENTFYGILPTLPYVTNYSEDFSLAEMNQKVEALENDGLATWTDSYNEGQVMNRLIQTARIADLMGNTTSRDKILVTIKDRLEDWLTYEQGEIAFLFYYNNTWSTLLGYPAGHGQDNNINDHHFHWGYFIHAAAFLEQYEPGWASNWGEMINQLVHDAASPDRNNPDFPFLRNFSPYAGHCWANGFATFPQGNDQESTSESMQFNSSLIHWGTITGNDEIRDLGIYLYTTEQTAIEEYWFDMHERNFSDTQPYSLVSRVWGNSYDNGTFWTADIAASYGIEMYPIHGGSLYLGHNTGYVQKLWTEITQNTGILSNEENPNLWHDVMWEYLAFIDPQSAIDLYNSYHDRSLKFGLSDAQTYYWLHAMNALGTVETSVTANHPLAVAFNKDGNITYVAQNYSNSPLTVTFSDGFNLDVPAQEMVTSRDVDVSASLSTSFSQAFTNGSVDLTVDITSGTPTKVEFFDGDALLDELTEAPFITQAGNLNAGVHNFYAKVYEGSDFAVTNIAKVVVGRQLPYLGSPSVIPGQIEAGMYDKFEGGLAQGIAYSDLSAFNEGDFRTDEYVDALQVNGEGNTVGWISSGEWMEYTVDIAQSGLYELSFRYACGNASGGGPFHLTLDGNRVSDDVSVNPTDAVNGWTTWASKPVSNIALTKGEHVLRIAFDNGELNLGRLSFSRTGDLPYNQPIADAGNNITVVLPNTTAVLDASNSESPGGLILSYQWSQNYGPSIAAFDDGETVNPQISNLEEGIYSFSIEVSNGSYNDTDEILVIVSNDSNIAPSVSIISPETNDQFMEGHLVTITASASDLDGQIEKVDFYEGSNLIGTSTAEPYSITWTEVQGSYVITAVASDNDDKASTSQAITLELTEAFSMEGTWKLAPQAKAMGVGPAQGDFSWWSNSEADLTTRACLFDDLFVFESDGTFRNIMGTETWVETWQAGFEGCGTPVAPHNGSTAATWSYDGSSLTITGTGAHIGLPKVINGNEINDPANAAEEITYIVSQVSTT